MFECAEEALAVPGFDINVERHLSVVQDGPAQFQHGAKVRCSLSIWRPQRRDSRHSHSHLDGGSFVGHRASWRLSGDFDDRPGARFRLFPRPKVAQHQDQVRTVMDDFQHSPAAADFRTDSVRLGFDKKKGQSVTAKALISLTFLVGGAGFEPATPAV